MTTTLKRWGDEKPERNSLFLIWNRGRDFSPEITTYFDDGNDRDVETDLGDVYQPDSDARWCYVPDAPDWSEIDD